MELHQLAYASRPFGFDDGILGSILMKARANNARNDVTGTLICRDDLFIQYLEGPERAVRRTFERIAEDDRHVEVDCLLSAPTAMRRFAGWAMRHDPARDWMFSRAEVDAGALREAGPEGLIAFFDRVAADPEDSAPARCPR